MHRDAILESSALPGVLISWGQMPERVRLKLAKSLRFRHAGVSQPVARNRRFRLVRSRYGCRKLPSISIPPGGVAQGEVGPYVCETLDQSADVGVAVQRRRGQP